MPRRSSSSSTKLFVGKQPGRRQDCDVRRPEGGPAQHQVADPGVLLRGRQRHPAAAGAGWILDCYADVDDIRAYGQTIVYTVHQTIGHLGIFVSGGVAKKEHAEFSSNIDLIDVLPPGLYEATFEAKDEETAGSDLVVGQWVMRCEARTLDDIRAMGGNTPEDERRFAAAKRLSEINLAAYQKYLQPGLRAW